MAQSTGNGSAPQRSGGARADGHEIHDLLTPDNCTVILIDHQPQMAFAVQSIDRQTLVNNVTGLAKAAKVFNVPVVLTSVAAKTFSGDIIPEVQAVFPDLQPIDRTSMAPHQPPPPLLPGTDDPELFHAKGQRRAVQA